jgi:hypothetical protein
MKRVNTWIAALLVLLLAGFAVSDALAGSVRGYYRRDGTYVQPHQRSNPDRSPYNNYNFPGNYNPNTGTITPGSQERYLERYYQQQRGLGGFGTYQTDD